MIDSAPMSYWRRLFLVVLLILSLPVQSYAAASMKCTAELSDASAHAAAAMYAEHDAPEHHHDMAMMTAALGEPHHEGGHAAHPHACSTCASCCFGAALPAGSVVAVPMVNSLVAIRIPPSAGVVSFLTGGIERPPRHFLV